MKKSSLIVVAIIVVFGLIYWFLKEDHISAGVKKLTLKTFAQEKVDRVEIGGKEPIKLVKENNLWKVDIGSSDKPHLVAANQEHIMSMLEAALAIKPSYYVTNLKDKHKDLGLSDGDFTRVVISSEGNVVWSLDLGKNDSGSGKYARLADQDEVYVVRGSFWSLTRNGPMDWREQSLWSVKDNELLSFALEKDAKPYLVLTKDADKEHWSIDKNKTNLSPGFREDKEALVNLVRNMISLRASGFVDAEQELLSPVITVRIGIPAGERVVSFYAKDADKYIAKKSDDNQIYEVAKVAVDRLIKPLEELRDLSVLHFDKASIHKIVEKNVKNQVVLEKKDGKWAIVEPTQLPTDFEFDPNTVEDLLSLLSGLRAERLAQPHKDIGVNSSWQKDWALELTNEQGEKTHFFYDKNKSNKDEYVVKGNIDGQVYVVKAAKLNALLLGIKAFKKEEFELPPIDENTRGFDSLPVDVQKKLLDAHKNKKK